jgi:Tol biopolymer transport system component
LTTGAAAEYAPAWSPDGKWIAFLRAEANGLASVMVMPAEGGEARQVVVVHPLIEPRKRWLNWSADGQWVLLAHQGPGALHQRVFAISAATGEQRQLTGLRNTSADSDGQPALSRDGGTLLFARDAETPGQIWKLPVGRDMRPAGEERRIALPGFEDKEAGEPVSLSAGEMLFRAPAQWINVLWRVPIAGGERPRQLVEFGDNAASAALSRDARKLVFARERYDTNVWRLDLDAPGGKEVRRERVLASTQLDENAALSPDGKTLAFESSRNGFPQIWRAGADGSSARQLTFFPGQVSSAQWSPDGREIAFHAYTKGSPDLYVAPSEGGALRRLTAQGPENQQPVWSPDGKWIYFCSLRSGVRELWRLLAKGGEAERVTKHGGFDVAFSPDGRWLYYSRLRAPNAAIWRMPVEGGEEKMLIESAIGGHVFATENRLYFGRASEIVCYELASGTMKVLARTSRRIRDRMAVTGDERSIYFSQVDDDGMDLVLAPEFR